MPNTVLLSLGHTGRACLGDLAWHGPQKMCCGRVGWVQPETGPRPIDGIRIQILVAMLRRMIHRGMELAGRSMLLSGRFVQISSVCHTGCPTFGSESRICSTHVVIHVVAGICWISGGSIARFAIVRGIIVGGTSIETGITHVCAPG